VLETQTYNPSYSGGRDQEDCGSKPVWANGLQDPILKNPSQKKKKKKKAGGVAQGEGPEFNLMELEICFVHTHCPI
jgi:hypothetical protein